MPHHNLLRLCASRGIHGTNSNFIQTNAHVKPSDVTTERDRNGLESTAFLLPRTKTSIHGESVSWSKQNGDTDPEKAFTHHLAIKPTTPKRTTFAYRHKTPTVLSQSQLSSKLSQPQPPSRSRTLARTWHPYWFNTRIPLTRNPFRGSQSQREMG